MNKIAKLTLGLLATASVVACNQQGETKSTTATPAATNAVAEAKEDKIVYVNSDSLSEQYQYFKDIRAKLEAKVKKAQSDLQAKGQAYQREVAEYQQKAGTMSATDRQATEERLMRRQQEIQRLDQNASQSIAQDESTEFNKVYTTVTDYLKKHAEEKGYKFVLTYSKTNPAVLYADPASDITKAVIESLNSEYKTTQTAEKK
ncbi:OmpH family outer membrane protein [Sphingobacterium sp. DK4209]|uniref:OmpH family outer membrane protein n=1 Tax=Sphingobacterium zhuxiongii TaxID=2662364 RepID=A0A5Q0QDI3_9SPHI|nr:MULTISPECIES: OmpH family outer membrane protein [unclassified Sphingobacterium]MVZ65529.1 OmpH family outer membrane protein [Sphingobacterium sp. DK4209]QGA27324.1 OmpH family outer membrane protein [Sphingobacterium sp. dk4302]